MGTVGRFAVAAVFLVSACLAQSHDTPGTSSGQNAPQVKIRSTTAKDGVRIVYEDRGSGDTALVFVHCWTCNRLFWREQVDVFSSKYRVVSLDLAGHGESGKDRKSWSVLGLADDVRAVADELRLQRMILVGHSMGAPVSLEAARLLGGRVIGVILVDNMQDVGRPASPENTKATVERLRDDFKGFFRDLSAMFSKDSDPAIRHWVEEQAMGSAKEPMIALWLDLADIDRKALFRGATVPIRAINAAPPLGSATDIEGNRKYADFDATLIGGAGHFVQLERSQEFNQQLTNWVTQLSRN